MVEMSSHSQALIDRSSTSQLRSFTSTIEQAVRPEDRLRSTCSEISTASIPSNHGDNDESFLLTLCRHKTLGTPPGSVRRGSKVNLQFRFSLTTPEQQQTRQRQPDQSYSFECAEESEVAQIGWLLRIGFWPTFVAAVSRRSTRLEDSVADGLAPFRLKTAHPGPGSFS
jgi:hypothetical protein